MLRTFLHPLSVTAAAALFIIVLMTAYPAQALESSLRGLSIWWEVLFPALFPFFVISELMLGFGIVHFVGRLLDPFMRPVFRLPGIGGFVVTLGYISGYPVGARITAQLWEQKLINRVEGERLVAFTTTSDPIFLIGAVCIGFFHNAALAPVLAAAHYGGALIIGFLMRYHDRHALPGPQAIAEERKHNRARRGVSRLREALQAMHQARLQDGRELGQLLQDAVQSALRLMIVVGGLVVFFSVVMEMLTGTGAIHLLSESLRFMLQLFQIPGQLADGAIFGLFEVTLGARAAGAASGGNAILIHQAAIAAWVLSWGGLSVHAQISSLISRTDMRYKPLLLARLLHGIIAMLLVYLLWGWLGPSS